MDLEILKFAKRYALTPAEIRLLLYVVEGVRINHDMWKKRTGVTPAGHKRRIAIKAGAGTFGAIVTRIKENAPRDLP